MNIRNILLPTDGSAASLKAAQLAGRLARQCGAEATVLLAVGPEPMGMASLPEELMSRIRNNLYEAGQAILQKTRAVLDEAGVPAKEQLVEDESPSEAIARVANQGGYDLIVIGSRGLGRHSSDRFFVGSVAEQVIRLAPCPVLVVKAE